MLSSLAYDVAKALQVGENGWLRRPKPQPWPGAPES